MKCPPFTWVYPVILGVSNQASVMLKSCVKYSKQDINACMLDTHGPDPFAIRVVYSSHIESRGGDLRPGTASSFNHFPKLLWTRCISSKSTSHSNYGNGRGCVRASRACHCGCGCGCGCGYGGGIVHSNVVSLTDISVALVIKPLIVFQQSTGPWHSYRCISCPRHVIHSSGFVFILDVTRYSLCAHGKPRTTMLCSGQYLRGTGSGGIVCRHDNPESKRRWETVEQDETGQAGQVVFGYNGGCQNPILRTQMRNTHTSYQTKRIQKPWKSLERLSG